MTAAASQLEAVCLDCRQPAALAPFWAAVLGYPMRPHSAELREPGGDIHWWILADPEGSEFCAFRRSAQ